MWVSWFKEVILKGSVSNFWTTKPSQSFSWLTNKLLKLGQVAYPLIQMRIRNGETCRFWIDNWSPYGKLQDYLEGGRSRLGISQRATLASLHRDGMWFLPAARTETQLQVLSFITTIQFTEEEDDYEWQILGKTSSKYCTGDVYKHLRGSATAEVWTKAIWISRGIPRQSFHGWLVALNRLPTRDRLISWGLQTPPVCLLCNNCDESRDHLYWECPFSFDLWNLVATRCRITPARTWVSSLLQMSTLPLKAPASALTLLGWQAVMYWTWNERNQRLHAARFRSADSLFSIIDHQLRNKISSFRGENPKRSSQMLQLWLS